MEITISVDFTDDIYKMCKYLLMVDSQQIDQKIGRFSLGRRTGHTTSLISVADKLSRDGYEVLCVVSSHMYREIRHSEYGYDIMQYVNITEHAFRGRDAYDIVLFDEVNSTGMRKQRELDNIINYMQCGKLPGGKHTALFFMQ
jgi:hypothetical protein